MSEIPILFSTPMVQAILAGKKTQTRRVAKEGCKNCKYDNNTCGYMSDKIDNDCHFQPKEKYKVGDILWVRETWRRPIKSISELSEKPEQYEYKADCTGEQAKLVGWKPSIYMPREACRLFLRVTGVRVERLQEITPEDCIKEGIIPSNNDTEDVKNYLLVNNFFNLWESLNTKRGYGWEANPFVEVVQYERVENYKGVK